MKHKDMNIIEIQLFVNNVEQFTVYLVNAFIQLFVNNIACFTAYHSQYRNYQI